MKLFLFQCRTLVTPSATSVTDKAKMDSEVSNCSTWCGSTCMLGLCMWWGANVCAWVFVCVGGQCVCLGSCVRGGVNVCVPVFVCGGGGSMCVPVFVCILFMY